MTNVSIDIQFIIILLGSILTKFLPTTFRPMRNFAWFQFYLLAMNNRAFSLSFNLCTHKYTMHPNIALLATNSLYYKSGNPYVCVFVCIYVCVCVCMCVSERLLDR